jgi:hypothetical protein
MAGLGLDPQLLQRINARIEILVRESQTPEATQGRYSDWFPDPTGRRREPGDPYSR